jgi:dihydroflavonol-4-reductase
MKTLVIGGTGLIGTYAALELSERGHEVTIGARREPVPESPVAGYPLVLADYSAGEYGQDVLSGFDAVVFAAGQDVRQGGSDADDEFWMRYQSDGVPQVTAAARDAGVSRFVQIGSCYHQAEPALIASDRYVRARADADTRARELSNATFAACTLNPPPIVGMLPGSSTRRFGRLVAWAAGEADGPDFAPPGGTNYMSARSLAEAIAGAIERGAAGAAYLVGDENLTYREYFQALIDLSGGTRVLAVRDEEHPFLPDRMIVTGRSRVFQLELDPATVELLGYRRHDALPMLAEMVATVQS